MSSWSRLKRARPATARPMDRAVAAPMLGAALVAPQPLSTVAPSTTGSAERQVWVNTGSGVYHCPGTRYYGNTKWADSCLSEKRRQMEIAQHTDALRLNVDPQHWLIAECRDFTQNRGGLRVLTLAYRVLTRVHSPLDKGTPGESRGRKATGPRRPPRRRTGYPRRRHEGPHDRRAAEGARGVRRSPRTPSISASSGGPYASFIPPRTAALAAALALGCGDQPASSEPTEIRSARSRIPRFRLCRDRGDDQISGVGIFDAGACPAPPTGYEDFISYPGIAMHGSLEGCWYTKVVTSRDNGTPSGVYQERGEEVFVGSFDGGPEGTFTTTYNFSSKWEPDVTNGSEVRGRCQHPIVAGSGTGGFEGATGRLDFKDDVVTGDYFWRGRISLP